MPLPRISTQSLLPDVDSRAAAVRREAGVEAGGLDEGAGTREIGKMEKWAGFRLCNLVAESTRIAEGRVPTRGGKRADGKRYGTIGDRLFQAVQESNTGDRAGD